MINVAKKAAIVAFLATFLSTTAMADGMIDEPQVEKTKVQKVIKKKLKKAKRKSCQNYPNTDHNDCACEMMAERTKLPGTKGKIALQEFLEVSCSVEFLPKSKIKALRKGPAHSSGKSR